MKKISILGSTGSIGTQTLEVIRRHPDDFSVTSLVCGRNISLLEDQIREFHPDVVCVFDEKAAGELAQSVRDLPVKVESGMDGLLHAAADPKADIVVTAVVGMIGIRPTMEAIRSKKTVALANKETLVAAGHLIMPLAKKYGVSILPVDSEHSAIFQSLQGNEHNRIRRILLTASGGPFRGKSKEELSAVTVEQALHHPNWSMGKKVTIDSATMVNKGLEVMEAHWLFQTDVDAIEVLVHPQSILHSAVEYEDGAVIGQLGLPDMKIPIQYALYYPLRRPLSDMYLDLFSVRDLTFEKPDLSVFTGLALAFEAMRRGGNIPTAFNAADEEAVKLFLEKKISFLRIPEMIGEAMDQITIRPDPSLDDIFSTEKETRELMKKLYQKSI